MFASPSTHFAPRSRLPLVQSRSCSSITLTKPGCAQVDAGAVKEPLVIGSQRLEGANGGAEKAGEGRREAKEWDEATRAIYTPLGGSHDHGEDAAKHAADQLVTAAKIAAARAVVGSGREAAAGERHAVTVPRRVSAGNRASSAAAAGAVSGKVAAAKEVQGGWGTLLDPLGVFGISQDA